jgi:release factor glutamine methyltransferase
MDQGFITAETTRGEAVSIMTVALREAGIDQADRDARKLVCGLLDIEAIRLIDDGAQVLGEYHKVVREALHRRLLREPVSRILGYRDFYGRRFRVTPATLDPRADSECVVTAAIEAVRALALPRPARILDIGTGSGCLLLSILGELDTATGVGSDISSEALMVAESNARVLGLAERASFVLGSGTDAVLDETFDVVVSNPPYIATAVIDTLEPDVRLYDPRAALDGGGDGLDLYRLIFSKIGRVIVDGWVICEAGDNQSADVAQLARLLEPEHRIESICITPDMAGRPRCVAVRTQRIG